MLESFKGKEVTEWENHDLEPSKVPIVHYFYFRDDATTHLKFSFTSLTKKNREEGCKGTLESERIKPFGSVPSFSMVIAAKKDEIPRLCVEHHPLTRGKRLGYFNVWKIFLVGSTE